jgi:hypothetical protein
MTHITHTQPSRRRPWLQLACGLAALTCLCVAADLGSAAASVESRIVGVHVNRSGIRAPKSIRPGVVTFRFTVARGTDESRALRLVRLNPGVSYEQIAKYMRAGDVPALLSHVTGYGGVSHSGIDIDREWTTRLSRGDYLLVDDEAGLASPLTVSGAPIAGHAPRARGTVALTRRGPALPKEFGDGTWRFVNRDSIAHEFALIKIVGHHSRSEVMKTVMSGKHPAWAPPVGTLNALGPNQAASFTFRHLHGTYLIEDWLPMLQGATSHPLASFYRAR